MRVLVTRMRPEADHLADLLAAQGHEALVEPLLEIRPVEGDPASLLGDLAEVQALLFTSANGVRAFAALSDVRSLPVFAVGDSTAAAAREAGFDQVESAGGDVEDLAVLVGRRLDPTQGALFHAAARQVAGDLKGALEARGFALRRAVLYEAVAVSTLSPATLDALRARDIDAVLLFSPRTGETFVRLVREHDLIASLVPCRAVCLSAAVAATVDALDWAGVEVAEQPTQEALLASLQRIAPGQIPGVSTAGTPKTGSDGEPMDSNDGDGSRKTNGSAQPPALEIIAAFGGIRPMAAKLGIAVSTVQGWRERGVIPQGRHDEVRRAAKDNGVTLDEDILAASANAPATAPSAQPAGTKPSEPAAASVSPSPSPSVGDKPVTASAAVATSAASAAKSDQRASQPRAAESKPAASASTTAGSAETRLPPPPPSPPRSDPGTGRLAIFAGVGIVALLVVIIVLVAAGPDGDPELETRLAALSERLAQQETQLQALGEEGSAAADLESRIAAVEEKPAVDEAAAALIADLQDRLATLEEAGPAAGARASAALQAVSSRVEALEADASIAAGGAAALDRRLIEMDKRLDALEQAQAEQGTTLSTLDEAFTASGVGDSVSDASLALALGQLRDALRLSAPYETELALVRQLVPADDSLTPHLDALAAHAGRGVPSLARLKADYPAMARKAASLGLGEEAEGLLSGVLRRVSEVVTIRPVGDIEGSGVGASLARAEARLGADDLSGAVGELEALEAPAAEAAAGWLSDARARLAADAAISVLGAQAVSRLRGADG